MTNNEKLREAGLEIVGRLDAFDWERWFLARPESKAYMVVRSIPPPEPTVEELTDDLWEATKRYYCDQGVFVDARAALDALIAAVERRARA